MMRSFSWGGGNDVLFLLGLTLTTDGSFPVCVLVGEGGLQGERRRLFFDGGDPDLLLFCWGVQCDVLEGFFPLVGG